MDKDKNELAPVAAQPKASLLATLGSRYGVAPAQLLNTLKETAFKGASEAQMVALCVVANEYNLNPFTKEIYAFPAKGGGIVPVIGVDGWYNMINSRAEFDGVEFDEIDDADGNLVKTTCRIYRKDRTRATEVSEHLGECRRNTDPWNQSPRRMLRHRSFIQCARIAFGISGSDPEDVVVERDITPAKEKASVTFDKVTEDDLQANLDKLAEVVAFPRMPKKAKAPKKAKVEEKVAETFTLEAEEPFPADADVSEQVEFLMKAAGMTEAELIQILRGLKVVSDSVDSVGFIGDKTLANVVKSWDMVLTEREVQP